MLPTMSPGFKETRHGAGSQKAGLGCDDQLVAADVARTEEFFERGTDRPFRTLMAIVDGGVEKIDTPANRGHDGFVIGAIGCLVYVPEISAETEARYLNVLNSSKEAMVTGGREPG